MMYINLLSLVSLPGRRPVADDRLGLGRNKTHVALNSGGRRGRFGESRLVLGRQRDVDRRAHLGALGDARVDVAVEELVEERL
eukprot:6195605-Pleurochrysis_carterae.AAC.1